MSEGDLLRAATAVAGGSGHPAAEELFREASARSVRLVPAVNCDRPGGGAAGVVAGSRVLLGSPEFLLDQCVDLSAAPPMETDWTTLFVAVDGRFAGVVRVEPW
jgi:Cd2+/Zn2+-exporting ATPase